MKKKFFSKLLMVALVATVGVFSSCKDYDDDIADVRNNLSQTATELRTDYTNKINAVNTKIETLQTSYDKLSKALDESNAQLQTLINTKFDAAVKAAEAYSDANLVKAKDAAAAAEAAAKAYAETQAAAAQSAAIAAAKEQVAAAKAELEAALAKANELIATQGQSISNLIEADKTLDLAIKAAQARADEAYALADKANTLAETNKANIAKAAADITALQQSLSALESKAADKADVAKLQSELAALQKQVGETVVNLADYKESIANITSELAKLKSDLEQQVSFLGENIAGVKKTAEANAASIESIITQLGELKKANDLAHQELANSVSALASKTSSDLAAAVQGIEGEIAAANKLIGDNTAAIASLTQTVQNNKDVQDKINESIQGQVGKNAQDIVAHGKEIDALHNLIPNLKSTLEQYAEKVAGEKAAEALKEANQFTLDKIAAQAKQDKENLSAFVNEVFQTLIKTYEVNVLAGLLENTRKDAEKNAQQKAQEISDDALRQAKEFAQNLNDKLAAVTPRIDDMNAAIEAAKNSAIAQAYVKVLNDLLRDQKEWYDQNDEDKLLQPSPTIYEVAMKCVQEYGLSKANAEELMNAILDAALVPSKGTGTYDAEGNEIIQAGGKIMVLIEAAAAKAAKDLADVNDALDARLGDIEAFLNTTSKAENLDATINFWIAEAKLAKKADLDDVIAQLKGEKDGELKTIITEMKKASEDNAKDIAKIMTSINKVTAMFAFLTPSGEDATIDEQLTAYENIMQKLADRIAAMADVVDNLDDKVMEAVNKNLGPQIQTMITSINLFANQHMADHDQQYKLAQWDGEKWIYPYGYDNFDHTLTFMYAVESGIYSNYCGTPTLAEESWNYPAGLIKQLKTISSTRDQQYPNDYDFSYDEGGFTGSASDFDFVDGRYRSYDDSILVRVSPTNADLSKAEIALLNSKGDDIIDAGLIELVEVKPYTRNSYIVRNFEYAPNDYGQVRQTRAAEGNATGLWVIKFKLNDAQVGELWDKYAYAKTTKDNKEQLTGNILYAVAVKNTDFSTEETADVDRYVVSEYDLDLNTAEPEHAWDFSVNGESIADIHNRYIMSEEAPNGETSWTDDPENYTSTFRYELTWHNLACDQQPTQPGQGGVAPVFDDTHPAYYTYCWHCWCLPDGGIDDDCEDEDYGYKHPAWSSILFKGDMDNYTDVEQKGVNTCDRHAHTFANDGKREMNGIDNRHQKDFLPIEFNYDMPGETDGVKWAKIDIEFPATNNCGVPTPIRGFFVTLDNHFAIESQNSEINAWAQYIYKNVAAYNYDHHVKKTVAADATDAVIDRAIVLQPGNKGTIYIKDAANILNDEIVGFRVHAVNLDGTLVDPDGRAFYVKIGKKTLTHELSFNITADTLEAYAVQNAVDGKNPIAAYNNLMYSEGSSDRFFNQPAYNSSYVDSRNYKVVYTWRADNPAIREDSENGTLGYIPVEGTGNGQENTYGTTKTVVKDLRWNDTYTNKTGYDVEDLFDFYYSENPNADIEDTEANGWKQFTTEDGETPNVKTMSMRASIKEGVANRLVDNGTYKIKMTILREDAQTVWSIVNVYDIDITKDMPTTMPKAFSVKSKQLEDGNWQFYVRPVGSAPAGTKATAEQTWKITWDEFDPNLTADKVKNGDQYVEQSTKWHNYRWAADTRPWTFEEIFNGLIVSKTTTTTDAEGAETETTEDVIDENYYFVFVGAGDFNAADAIKTAKADNDNKDKDAYAVYGKEQTIDEATSIHGEGAYRLPNIHYSHVNNSTEVKAGYIYRGISAKLNKDGNAFLAPKDEVSSLKGLNIMNEDLKLDPVAIPTKNSQKLTAKFNCAFWAGLSLNEKKVNNAIVRTEIKYGEKGKLDAKNMVVAIDNRFIEGNANQGYFDAAFGDWNGKTLVDLLATPYLKIDLNSLAVEGLSPTDYILSEYYKVFFADAEGNELEGENLTSEKVKTIGFDLAHRTQQLPALKTDVTGYITFNVVDIWNHVQTKQVKLYFKLAKPTNQAARQTR